MVEPSDVPVYKVGAVVVRDVDSAEPKFLLVKPSKTDDKAPWVLPRGTCRAYDAVSNTWVDLRSPTAIEALKDAPVEDFAFTAANELAQEAGIENLDPAELQPLGMKIYHKSPTKQTPVYWFGMVMEEDKIASINPKPSEAAESARWMTIDEMQALAKEDKARHGYIEICKWALSELRTHTHRR